MINDDPKGKSSGCCLASPDIVTRLEANVVRRTDKSLTARFGISYNTWRKLLAGQPVRASVLHRLQNRLDQLESDDGGSAHTRPGTSDT